MTTQTLTKPCPKCAGVMIFNAGQGAYRCESCGRTIYETLEEAQERLRRQRESQPSVSVSTMTYDNDVTPRAKSLLEGGRELLRQGQREAALKAFKAALEMEHDYIDAHLWIAKLTADETIKRDHLSEVIAQDPGNAEALRMLMVLNGRLTQAQADQMQSARDVIKPIQVAPDDLTVSTTALLCPVCGGALTTDAVNARVFCAFCGHTAPLSAAGVSDGADVLGAALLERKAQPVQWVIGSRMLHCNQCGADRTIPARTLTMVCPFCTSTQVVEQDALDSIERPDGLIPFTISENQAQQAVRDGLKTVSQRVSRLFDDNTIASASLEGTYLPYWVFDAQLEISRTEVNRSVQNRDLRTFQPYQNSRFRDGLIGIDVPAFTSPPRELIRKIDQFEASEAVGYDPRLLARYSAALYDIDFDAASLDARQIASAQMRARYQKQQHESQITVTVSTLVLQMSFMLLLMPFWIARLVERDGDVRLAIINGQNGRVAFGRAVQG